MSNRTPRWRRWRVVIESGSGQARVTTAMAYTAAEARALAANKHTRPGAGRPIWWATLAVPAGNNEPLEGNTV